MFLPKLSKREAYPVTVFLSRVFRAVTTRQRFSWSPVWCLWVDHCRQTRSICWRTSVGTVWGRCCIVFTLDVGSRQRQVAFGTTSQVMTSRCPRVMPPMPITSYCSWILLVGFWVSLCFVYSAWQCFCPIMIINWMFVLVCACVHDCLSM